MKIALKIILFVLIFRFDSYSQNLLSNSSFSEIKKNITLPPKVKQGELASDIKDWYLPSFINFKVGNVPGTDIFHVSYFSSRDKSLISKNRAFSYPLTTNGEQLFENNLGFLSLYINSINNSSTVIQQKLKYVLKPGAYCFKFRYKSIRRVSSYMKPPKLEFSFTNTDLKEYYGKMMRVPKEKISVVFQDSLKNADSDENIPWQDACYKINLAGNEKFLTIGTLSNDNNSWGGFLIDDIELYPDTSICRCTLIDKDLINFSDRTFPLNTIIKNDTMIAFTPENLFVGRGILSPTAKDYLKQIAAFMQRNTDVKIEFIEYNHFNDLNRIPTEYATFASYLMFFNIKKQRISVKNALCEDEQGVYCGQSAQFVKIGFLLFREY